MKSNHQPYEEWILSGRDLGQDQSQALKEHLRTCNACRRLSNAWLQVEGQLNLAPMALPEPGFGDRWLARLEVESQRRWRQQTFLVRGCVFGCSPEPVVFPCAPKSSANLSGLEL